MEDGFDNSSVSSDDSDGLDVSPSDESFGLEDSSTILVNLLENKLILYLN